MSEYLTAQLTDFGTSRAKAHDSDSVTMTGVGTPLFAAPELMRGEVYDESVDVYSFAIVLLAMAVEEDMPEWFQKRYAATMMDTKKKKKKKPPKIMKVLRSVWEEGWRPYDGVSTKENGGASSRDGGGNEESKVCHAYAKLQRSFKVCLGVP